MDSESDMIETLARRYACQYSSSAPSKMVTSMLLEYLDENEDATVEKAKALLQDVLRQCDWVRQNYDVALVTRFDDLDTCSPAQIVVSGMIYQMKLRIGASLDKREILAGLDAISRIAQQMLRDLSEGFM